MRNYALYFSKIILLLVFGVALSSCEEKCGPTLNPLLTETEKAFIANQPGDTLHFEDNAGEKYYMVCKNKTLAASGFSHTGHNNPCEDTDVRWDKLVAEFEGNILNDQNQPISLRIKIEGGYQPYDPGGLELNPACNSNYKCFFYLIFNNSEKGLYQPQTFWGRTEGSLFPVIINYGFKSEIMLGGQKFQKINTNSIANKCSGETSLVPAGLDSVYYSTQYGLIRLTTVGGKKYQRVL
ncbi:hypothetical protein [Adhaeribacter terreus]|uniref:Lipoprotein n=1 Tax=Adhaeribacter terreus TaxID=529703 RepID=A0ABW0E7A3_9BACT